MADYQSFLQKLEYLSFSLDDLPDYFKEFFGEELGAHLASKWEYYDRDAIKLYNSLDLDNKIIFEELVESLPRFNDMPETYKFEREWSERLMAREAHKFRCGIAGCDKVFETNEELMAHYSPGLSIHDESEREKG